jgi:hypothetical protein
MDAGVVQCSVDLKLQTRGGFMPWRSPFPFITDKIQKKRKRVSGFWFWVCFWSVRLRWVLVTGVGGDLG